MSSETVVGRCLQHSRSTLCASEQRLSAGEAQGSSGFGFTHLSDMGEVGERGVKMKTDFVHRAK